jgi:hypothetical protein
MYIKGGIRGMDDRNHSIFAISFRIMLLLYVQQHPVQKARTEKCDEAK